MQAQTLKSLFIRELGKLKQEIESYKDEKKIWVIDKGISNSGGNLCLHLVGNLNTFIGKELGKTNYIRNRDLEFSQKDVSQAELIRKIEDTIAAVGKALDPLTDAQMAEEYPVLVFAEKTSTGFLLISMISHLSYHLGQINYHRRMLDIA
jgi:hypothetical protein